MLINLAEHTKAKNSGVLSQLRFIIQIQIILFITTAALLSPHLNGQKLGSIKEPKMGLPASALRPWVCGVWMHPGMFGREKETAIAKIRETLDSYAQAGVNTVIMLVKDTSGYVFYQSDIGVKAPGYDWDFFGVFLEEAKKRKLTVHPWFCVFPETALVGQVRQHPEWLIVGPGREMVRTVNPALPEVRAYEISLMVELVKKYGVDWVHLDYIRFPCEPTEPYFSHDARTLQLFKEETGIDFNSLKARDSGNPYWNVWLEWNRRQVTRFVRELKEALAGTGHQVKISAAVFPDADNARVLIGQDWAEWAELGLVDMLCPMLYTNDTALFERLTKRAMAIGRLGRSVSGERGETGSEPSLLLAASATSETEESAGKKPIAISQAKGRNIKGSTPAGASPPVLICPGIGLGTSHNQNTPEIMLEEVGLARAAGANGVIFFSGGSLTSPFLEKLKMEEGLNSGKVLTMKMGTDGRGY